mmetsp:Transcript_17689/g.44937  ORF Transcript_17689/g.44937 Transcript_17689/m.44937 type:complete len:87 (-) Transcript_17689:24-284(-)
MLIPQTLPDRTTNYSSTIEFNEEKSYFRTYPFFSMRHYRAPICTVFRDGYYRKTEGELEDSIKPKEGPEKISSSPCSVHASIRDEN